MKQPENNNRSKVNTVVIVSYYKPFPVPGLVDIGRNGTQPHAVKLVAGSIFTGKISPTHPGINKSDQNRYAYYYGTRVNKV